MMASVDELTIKELIELVEKGDTTEIIRLIVEEKKRWNKLMDKQDELKEAIKKAQKISLRKENLEGKDLSNVNLRMIDFSGANLKSASLKGSDIKYANFSGANLYNANLSYAKVSQSDFSGANIYKAELKNAYMTGSVNMFNTYDGGSSHYKNEDTRWSYGDVYSDDNKSIDDVSDSDFRIGVDDHSYHY